jgi:hypothetical protein
MKKRYRIIELANPIDEDLYSSILKYSVEYKTWWHGWVIDVYTQTEKIAYEYIAKCKEKENNKNKNKIIYEE